MSLALSLVYFIKHRDQLKIREFHDESPFISSSQLPAPKEMDIETTTTQRSRRGGGGRIKLLEAPLCSSSAPLWGPYCYLLFYSTAMHFPRLVVKCKSCPSVGTSSSSFLFCSSSAMRRKSFFFLSVKQQEVLLKTHFPWHRSAGWWDCASVVLNFCKIEKVLETMQKIETQYFLSNFVSDAITAPSSSLTHSVG